MHPRWLRITATLLLSLALLIAALYAWLIHTPDPDPDWQVSIAQQQIEVDGLAREFLYYTPAAAGPRAPLIFVLHGSASRAASMRRLTAYAFEHIAAENGAIVVYPQGFENHWNDCRASADYSANRRNIDDPAFFAAMIDWFVAHYGADRRRVLVTGLSNGGHMAYRLALERPELVTAIAPIAANLPVEANRDCRETGAAVPVVIFNGTADPINPYQGGLVSILGNSSRGAVLSSLDTASYWAGLAGYAEGTPLMRQLPDPDQGDHSKVRLQHWQATGHVEVALYTILGGGHTVPSDVARTPRILGRTTHDIDAARISWEFFRRHWRQPSHPPAQRPRPSLAMAPQ